MWVRPPDITFLGVEEPQNGTSEVTVQTNGFLINFDLDVRSLPPLSFSLVHSLIIYPSTFFRFASSIPIVSLKNRVASKKKKQLQVALLLTSSNIVFGATFKEITATAFYPTNKTQSIGGGQMTHVKIPKYSNDTLHFPFTIDYTTTIDPGLLIVTDIATKCGFLGTGGTEDLTVDYTIKLGLNIAGVIISPSFSSSASFACPLTESGSYFLSSAYLPSPLSVRGYFCHSFADSHPRFIDSTEVAGFLGSSGLSGLTSSLGTRSQHEDFAWDEKRRWAEDLMKLLKRI